MKNANTCAISIQGSRVIRRKAIEHEIQFLNEGQLFVLDFRANKKYLTVVSNYPLKGVRSCVEHDGSLVKKLKMGYFNNQELQLSQKGDMILSFLINDVVNTTHLAKKNPNIIIGYYQYIRKKLEECFPSLKATRIKGQSIKDSPFTAVLSDSIRKKYFFSFNGTNMFLSFQAIIENHPELFEKLLN